MRNFIKYLIVALALPAFISLVFIEALARRCPNSYAYKHDTVTQRGEYITTLLLGGSRAYHGIDPAYIDEGAFSLANVSQPLYLDCWVLKKYHPFLPHLRTVILEVNNANIAGSADMGKGMEWFRLIYYGLYMDYPTPLFSRYHFEVCNFTNAKRKAVETIHALRGNKNHTPCSASGWGMEYGTAEKFDPISFAETARVAAQRHNHPVREHFDFSLQKLEEIALYCNENNLRLILVTTPLSSEYRNAANPTQFDFLAEAMERMKRKYGAEYLDYANDPRFQGKDFYDGDHLSHQGAAKFSSIFKEDAHL